MRRRELSIGGLTFPVVETEVMPEDELLMVAVIEDPPRQPRISVAAIHGLATQPTEAQSGGTDA